MANTYTWKISQMEAKISDGEKKNVIFRIWWELVASDEEIKPTYALAMDVLEVQYNEGDPFIEYADLTKEDVISWLESGLDVDDIKSKLDQEIYDKKNPVNEYLNPNWD
jgi:hypothetical protein